MPGHRNFKGHDNMNLKQRKYGIARSGKERKVQKEKIKGH